TSTRSWRTSTGHMLRGFTRPTRPASLNQSLRCGAPADEKELEVAMIEVYLQDVFLRERLANARRDAELYRALRELEAQCTPAWRAAIHRLFHAVSSVPEAAKGRNGYMNSSRIRVEDEAVTDSNGKERTSTMLTEISPIAVRPWTLNGISERMIVSHYENNYGGVVRTLNAVRREIAALDGVA